MASPPVPPLLPILLCAAALLPACASGNGNVDSPATRDPLFAPIDLDQFRGRPGLLAAVRATPHAYYRLINVRFADEVCGMLGAAIPAGPAVNIHGDAHVEQYSVSAHERGLADFDAATTGPAALDLMRFLVSLRLALHQRGWSADAPAVSMRFLAGYREALHAPDVEPPEPVVAQRKHSAMKATTAEWLDRMQLLMRPLDEQTRGKLDHARRDYETAMRAQNPALPPGYFDIKKAGLLHMGIGSAFEMKFLARLEGPSDKADDDVLIEVKKVPDLSGVRCIQHSSQDDPFRIIAGQTRLGVGDNALLGYLTIDDKMFYVQRWRVNYVELSIADFKDSAELGEVAHDVGNQLGRGHPKVLAAPHDAQLRRLLQRTVEGHEEALLDAAEKLERRVFAAWEAARAQGDD
ncbi:MAG: DUF2252 family protein [Polyangiaceae bacterium]